MVNSAFWTEKSVFITGHTGFKGSWLSLWLHALGAKVTGYSLLPPTKPSLYELARIDERIESVIGDIREQERLRQAIIRANPDVVIHMAAQPLVRASYQNPLDTYEINVMGTMHLLEAVRHAVNHGVAIRVVVNVTTDKCYENKEWFWGYRENDTLGGRDPYSSSKACAELLTASYRDSFFPSMNHGRHGVSIATARAGNVIGGGDWARDRLLPDCIRAILAKGTITLRNPHAVRPWQHVLEPLRGYLLLAQKMWEQGADYAQSWNFGPDEHAARSVESVVGQLCELWGDGATYKVDGDETTWHEAGLLKLDCSKAAAGLGWKPRWSLDQTLASIVAWTRAYQEGRDMQDICLRQIEQYSCHRATQ